MENPANTNQSPPSRQKVGFWRKLGGGSLTVSILVHAIILLLGAAWIIRIIPPPKEKTVDFMPSGGGGGNPANQSISQQKQRASMTKPNLSRISVAGVSSNITLPEMDDSVQMPTLGSITSGGSKGLGGSGAGGGRGDGIGKGFGPGTGPGAGLGGGTGATFFEQEVKAQRVAFVIDYSLSMKGKREQLLRAELSRSVSKLAPGMYYQTIFFAGPTWLGGNYVQMSADNRSASVTDGKLSYNWILENGNWSPKGRAQRIEWMISAPSTIEESLTYINESKLNWGTEWEPALEMAFRLRPAPQVIFFMTDGVAGGDLEKITRRMANRAKTHDTRINTVAMMEPNANEAMKYLAKETGGMFTIIEASGAVRRIPLD